MFELRGLFTRWAAAGLLFASLDVARATAQDCAGLPQVPPPKLEKCDDGWRSKLAGSLGLGCQGNNKRLQQRYDALSRTFATPLTMSGRDTDIMVTADSIRGCKGSHVNIEVTPGEITSFEYELVSPSNVTVTSGHMYPRGAKVLGNNITLPETGYYLLRTRTDAPRKTDSFKQKNGSYVTVTTWPRTFTVSFRTDANMPTLSPGDKVDATATLQQPFFRVVKVKAGSKVRFRLSSDGTGSFLAQVNRSGGEELYRTQATGFYESPAITPKEDEEFRVEARPASSQSVGIALSIVDDQAAGESVNASSRVSASFKLPAHFDARIQRDVSASETSRLVYETTKPESVTMTVRPSELAGLHLRIRSYNKETEAYALKPLDVSGTTQIPVIFADSGRWVIELSPLAATDLAEAGEAKYAVEFGPYKAVTQAGAQAAGRGADASKNAPKKPPTAKPPTVKQPAVKPPSGTR